MSSIARRGHRERNLFGEDVVAVTTRRGQVVTVGRALPQQLTITGEAEEARTLRNQWTEQRERDDERRGMTAR